MIWLLACAYPSYAPRPADTDSGVPADADTDADADADSDADTADDTCTPTLSDVVDVVLRDATTAEDGVQAWVCRNATYSVTGADARVYGDPRADLVLSGSGARGWATASTRLFVYGDGAEVWVEEGTDLHVEAEDVVVHTCPAVSFLGGPADGC
jgi:hypothetical protein